jgi:hypothetical protein
MSFLAPLFLLGGLAVSLPVVFHLIRRTTKERVPFSSLMFLMPSPPRVTRRSRLEHILLLLLRCVVLCLLALAFARPFFQKPMRAMPPAERAKKLVMLIDTSASMRREGLWAQARDQAEAVLRQAGPGDQVALFAFDRQARQVMGFEEWNASGPAERVALAVQRLAAISPSWGATHLGTAVGTAVDALEAAEKAGPDSLARQVVIISDLQEGSRLDGLQGFEWPRGIEVDFEPIKAQQPTNAGLHLVADNPDTAADPTNLTARARVSNSGTSKREQFQLRWADLAGTPLAGAAPVEVYVPPGQSRVVAVPLATSPTAAQRLTLTGDDDDFDNTAYVVPTVAQQVTVLYLGNPSETDPTQPLYFLKRAFQQTRRQNVQLAARAPNTLLTDAEAGNSQLLIVTEPLPEAQANAVRSFLQLGRTVLLAMRSAEQAPTIAHLAGVGTLTATEAPASRYALLGEIDFQHPLFAPFADPRFSDFTKIHFWKHRRLDTDGLPTARALARFDDGDAALVQVPVGRGNLFVLTTCWHTSDSQLALSSKFVPLLYSFLELSGAVKTYPAQYQVGDDATLTQAGGTQPIAVRKPDGTTVTLPAGQTKFSQTDQPGLYEVPSAQPPLRFAVNLAPEESKTAPLSLDEFERLGVPVKQPPSVAAERVEQQRQQQLHVAELEARQKLWRHLLVLALVVLMAETWLAGWLTRRAAPQTEAAT